MDMQKASNIYWHAGQINRNDRERLNGHRGFTLWFTGLPASGKSTLAVAVEKALHESNCRTYILDGDNIRHGLNKDLGFAPEDRTENIRRIGEVANLFRDCGVINLVAFISPYHSDRKTARECSVNDGTFIEVFVDCPIEICEARDPKGMYRKARAGVIKEFTGISAPYEVPIDPEICVPTHTRSLKDGVRIIMQYLVGHQLLFDASVKDRYDPIGETMHRR
jgi:adenylylsulfate kinase